MTDRLEDSDRSVLEYRPNIAFVEPDQQEGVIDGVDDVQFEDVQDARLQIKKLAEGPGYRHQLFTLELAQNGQERFT